MATEVFNPPINPSFAWDVTDRYSTIQNEPDRGHRITRARRDRKLRAIELRWENANQATFEYLRAFSDFHLGAAVSFFYDLPCVDLYTPGPAFFPTGLLAQGAGGALADGTYNLRYTFENANGETLAAPREQLVIAAGGGTASIVWTMPPRLPSDATLFGLYTSLDPAVETKQTTNANPNSVETITALASTGALPTVNAMQGRLTATFTDQPRYRLVASGVWVAELTILELLA